MAIGWSADPRQASTAFCRGKPSALHSPMTVPKLGLGIRPTSILRNVSGEMPASREMISGSRPALAALISAPRRCPAFTCSAVRGTRTMAVSIAGIQIPTMVTSGRYKNTDAGGSNVIELKNADEITKMATTGAFVAQTLATLSVEAQPGVNLMQLEHHARELIADRGAESCYWDYAPSFGRGPFRNVICLSVNDAVLHGMPRDYLLGDGDVLSLDFAVSIDGWSADSAVTVIVGDGGDAADRALIE